MKRDERTQKALEVAEWTTNSGKWSDETALMWLEEAKRMSDEELQNWWEQAQKLNN